MNRSRQQGALRIASIFVLALAGATALIAVWLSSGLVGTEKWPIRWLEIDGQFERVSAEQIRSQLEPMVNTGFFAVNLEQIRQAAEALPWVMQAEARKQWPDTVRLQVVEQRPIAHWREDYLVGEDGQAFQVPGSHQIQALPRLAGPEDRLQHVLTMWRAMQEQLNPIGVDIAELELQQRGAWTLQLNNRVRLALGRDAVIPRLRRLVAVWPSLLQHGQSLPRHVDLRYTNGFAVRWNATESGNTEEGDA